MSAVPDHAYQRYTERASRIVSAARDAEYADECAKIDPGAQVTGNTGEFSYSLAAGERAYLMAAHGPVHVGGFPVDVRDWNGWHVAGQDITGEAAIASAVIVDPSRVVITGSPENRYHAKLARLLEMPTHTVGVANSPAATRQWTPLLPGPYGIAARITQFNLVWSGWTRSNPGYGVGGDDELGDNAAHQTVRNGNDRPVFLDKRTCCQLTSGPGGDSGGPTATCGYCLLPSDYSDVPDDTDYVWRDDFMSLDADHAVELLDTAANWTRVQSTAGNIEIDPKFAWLGVNGSGAWGTNGAYTQQTFPRAAGRRFVVDAFFAVDATDTDSLIFGLTDGGSHSFTAYAHGLLCGNGGINLYEDGNPITTIGNGYTPFANAIYTGALYSFRFTPAANGSCLIEIRGGTDAEGYEQIDRDLGGDWTVIRAANLSTSAKNTLRFGVSPFHNNATRPLAYFSDVRVY